MKALVGTFNLEKALIGVFSVNVKSDGLFAALVICLDLDLELEIEDSALHEDWVTMKTDGCRLNAGFARILQDSILVYLVSSSVLPTSLFRHSSYVNFLLENETQLAASYQTHKGHGKNWMGDRKIISPS